MKVNLENIFDHKVHLLALSHPEDIRIDLKRFN